MARENLAPIAFASNGREPPHIEIRINFGVFAGREATPAELDDLGRVVLAEVEHVTLVSEHRHELGGHTETSLHQVRMDVPRDVLPGTRSRPSRCATGSSGSPRSGREAASTRVTPR